MIALSVICVTSLPRAAQARLDISLNLDLFGAPLPPGAPPPAVIAIAPPPLPVYVVPSPPMMGYVWSPGHWRWNGDGYFWVPGTWVQPPVVGLLWTPGYWGWREGVFAWNEGYWAPHVGFYGGINYGGGYGGSGFVGGSWNNGHYVVNRSVTNVTNITNVTNVTNTSFSGGPGGTTARPTGEELAAASEKHIPPTRQQIAHVQAAARNPALAASANHGKPSIAATPRAGEFTHNVVAARAAGPGNAAAEAHNQAVRQNPSLAKGAVFPKESAPHPQNKPQPKPQEHQPVAHQNEQRLRPDEERGSHVERPQEEPGTAPREGNREEEHKEGEHTPSE